MRILYNLLLVILVTAINIAYAETKQAPFDVLFHGSNTRKIEVIKPQSHYVRDEKEGAVIFATPSLKLASCFLFRWDDSWVHQFIQSYEENKDFDVYLIISDLEKFYKADKGGAIYLLPAKDFYYDENKGLGIYEWTTNIPVVPLDQLNFSSTLKTMQKFGVKIYFLDKKYFKKLPELEGKEKIEFIERKGKNLSK
ncbi:MAG: hypothetical protein J0H68_00590 [Sphingobacteriia bacterium]|nr:hypothetical protein [Sphingobacteriia bacterium]